MWLTLCSGCQQGCRAPIYQSVISTIIEVVQYIRESAVRCKSCNEVNPPCKVQYLSRHASVAQLVEQCPFKAFVVGSNPTGCILQFTSMKGIVMYCNYFVFDNLDDLLKNQ